MKLDYESPELREVGSLTELTQNSNKKHSKPDKYSAATNVVGSFYPVS
jgi:hypothetical protein